MTPNCSNCVNVGVKQVQLNGGISLIEQCNRNGRSAAWERAAKLSTHRRNLITTHWDEIPAIQDNCGPSGQFFTEKARSAVA